MTRRVGDAAYDQHRWWDRRMSVWNNLRFGFILPAVCRVVGHRFEWFGVVADGDWQTVVHEFGVCRRCVASAKRPPSDEEDEA